MWRWNVFALYVGDQLPTSQRPTGYAMQSFFIGIGSVVARLIAMAPRKRGRRGLVAAAGEDPQDCPLRVLISGGAMLFIAVGWTIAQHARVSRRRFLESFDMMRSTLLDNRVPLATSTLVATVNLCLAVGSLLCSLQWHWLTSISSCICFGVVQFLLLMA